MASPIVFECPVRTLDIPRDFILAQLALANAPADVDLHTDDPLQQPDDSVENSRPLRELLFAAKKHSILVLLRKNQNSSVH
jgi:hypothetical protein